MQIPHELLDEFVLIGRQNPITPGGSPFTPICSGVCIDPNGVVATCYHGLHDFMLRWSPIPVSQTSIWTGTMDGLYRHEVPRVSFQRPATGAVDPVRGWPVDAFSFPFLSWRGDRIHDVAVIELGGRGRHRPLPYAPLTSRAVEVDDRVMVTAHFGHEGPPLDSVGQVMDWGIRKFGARVVAFTETGFLIDADVAPGMSGAGVRDSAGGVVGLVIESWSAALSFEQVGIERRLVHIVGWRHIARLSDELRASAESRYRGGGYTWCSVRSSSQSSRADVDVENE